MRPKDEAAPTTDTGSDSEIEALEREARAAYRADWHVPANRARYRAAVARLDAWHARHGPTPHELIVKFVREVHPGLRAVDDPHQRDDDSER